MLQSAEDDFFGAREMFGEGEIAGKIRAERKKIDEIADDVGPAAGFASGGGSADDDVVLASVEVQENVEDGEEKSVVGDAGVFSSLSDFGRQADEKLSGRHSP